MTTHNLTYQECAKHAKDYYLRAFRKDAICGCPRTTRAQGLLVYKHDITGNWVVWDCSAQEWLSLCGDYQTALKRAFMYIDSYPPEPVRCRARCSQWPNCTHDWRNWHRVISQPWGP